MTGPVKLGNPDEFSILELARKVIENDRLPLIDCFPAAAS